MRRKDFLETQSNLCLMGDLLQTMDLEEFARHVDEFGLAEQGAGAAINPDGLKRLAEAAGTLRDAYLEVRREAELLRARERTAKVVQER